jgi:ABC-type nitrate/sulfonate/bicarbonate transport system permease component
VVQRFIRGIIVPALAIAVWEAASRTGILKLEFLSRPSDILAAGIDGLRDGSILGLSRPIERTVGPTIEALRPIPAVAFIPLTLLLFGFGLPMEGTVVAYACVWPILIATVAAVRGIEPRLLEVAQALELSFAERMRKIILPAALGRINVGVRVAVGFALVVAVTVEIVVNPRGLGYSLIVAQQSLRIDLMYAQLLWLSILGYTVNALLRTVRTSEPDLQAGRAA